MLNGVRLPARHVRAVLWLTAIVTFALLLLPMVRGDVGSAQSPTRGLASRVGAEAAAAITGSPPQAVDRTPYAALPPGGGDSADTAAQGTLGGLGLLDLPGVSVSGGPVSVNDGSATAIFTAYQVYLLGGRVQAQNVRVAARAETRAGQASVDGEIEMDTLLVDGIAVPAPMLNQTIPLPGIGQLVVRELLVDRPGTDRATVIARAFRVVPDETVSALGGEELIVGSAVAGVPNVALSPPLTPQLQPRTTIAPILPLSTRSPIDRSLDTSRVDNDNLSFDDNFEEDNESDDNVRTGGSTGGTVSPARTSTPVVVTVVVVVQTATPQVTATPSPSATPVR